MPVFEYGHTRFQAQDLRSLRRRFFAVGSTVRRKSGASRRPVVRQVQRYGRVLREEFRLDDQGRPRLAVVLLPQ